MTDAFAVFGILTGGDVDAILVEHGCGVDLAGTLGGGILEGFAILRLVFGRVDVEQDRLAHRNQSGAEHALKQTEADQLAKAVRDAAQPGHDREAPAHPRTVVRLRRHHLE